MAGAKTLKQLALGSLLLLMQATKTLSENVQDWHYMVRELTCKGFLIVRSWFG
jgi:hypothetical protein